MEAFDVTDVQEVRERRRRTDAPERERIDLTSFEEVMWDYIARQAREDFR